MKIYILLGLIALFVATVSFADAVIFDESNNPINNSIVSSDHCLVAEFLVIQLWLPRQLQLPPK